MKIDSTPQFMGALLDLIDDLCSEIRTRMIATQLLRSVAATATRYRNAQRARFRGPIASKMCLVLEETDPASLWLERVERKRLSRRLESVRQAIRLADEIIEKTFYPRRSRQPLTLAILVPNGTPGPSTRKSRERFGS